MSATNFESFSKLKKDLLFHERRMQLLLATRVVEDLGSNLREKQMARDECAGDCRTAIDKFEAGAAEGRLTGGWDELRVASRFGLEVPLTVIIGSNKFEKPPEDNGGVAELVERVQRISARFPEFASHNDDGGEGVETFRRLMAAAQWTPRDVTRIKEAINAKLLVLTELDQLADALQDTAYAISCQETKLEELRRAEERAEEDGEMALADAILAEKLAAAEKMLDLHFFQIHTVESSVDSNVTKRRSNLTVFQGGAAMIECIKKEKLSMAEGCAKDLARIQRGLQYEDKATGDQRHRTRESLQQSLDRIRALDTRQQQLSTRLRELFRDFAETEQALEQVGVERAKAVEAHVELVEGSRHATSDFHEMAKFAEVYEDNLLRTREEYTKGIAALDALEKLLLQQRDFDSYDFNATARRLSTMQRRVCLDLNRALNEYETLAEDARRRNEARLRQLDADIEQERCALELRRDVLDPATKKHVLAVRELEAKRAQLLEDIERLRVNVERHRAACLEKIRQHLNSEEIVDVSDLNATRTMRRREDLLDMRQATATPDDSFIVLEREALQRARLAITGGSAGGARKTTASRVAALRNDVERFRGPLDDATARIAAGESTMIDSSALPPDVSTIEADPDATTSAGAAAAASVIDGATRKGDPAPQQQQKRGSGSDSTIAAIEADRLEAIRANASAIEARTMAYRKKARTIGSPSPM